MAVCPIYYGAAIVAQAVMQAAKLHGFEGVGSSETSGGLLEATQCMREACQWWGWWEWGEEGVDAEGDSYFYKVTAHGCTFGQLNCKQQATS